MAYLPTSNRREAAQTASSSTSDSTSKVPGFTKEMIDLVKKFVEEMNYLCNTKTSKILDKNGKEIGRYNIQSRDF